MVKPFGRRSLQRYFHNKHLENSKIGLENSWNHFHPKSRNPDWCEIGKRHRCKNVQKDKRNVNKKKKHYQ